MSSLTTGAKTRIEPGARKEIIVQRRDILWVGFLFIVVPITYFASTFLLSYYIYGDQVFYTNFYESLQGQSLLQVPFHQLLTTGSAEPVYGFSMWVGANMGIEKIVFISFVNIIFVLLTGLAIRKLGGSVFIATLIFTNYYFVVMLTSAERLKFSFIFLALIFLASRKLKVVAFLLAPLCHFQTIINYASWLSNRFFQTRISDFKKRSFQIKAAVYFLIAIIAGNYVLARYGSVVAEKFAYYNLVSTTSFLQLLKVLLLLLAGLLMQIRLLTLVSYLLPILVAVALLGPDRVNMIGFTMFFYLTAQEKKLGHPIFIAVLLFFSFKSIEYVGNIITFGTGYPV